MKRKWFSTVIGIFLLCICFSVLEADVAEAKTAKYKTAYLKIVKQFDKQYPQRGYAKNRYALVNIDNDKIPELICDHQGYFLSVYTYKNGKTYCLTREKKGKNGTWAYGAGGNAGYYYLPKKNTILNVKYSYPGSYYTYWKITKQIFKQTKQRCYKIGKGAKTPSIKKYKFLGGNKSLSQIKKLLK